MARTHGFRKHGRGKRQKRFRRNHRRLRTVTPLGASPIARKLVTRMKYCDVIDWNVTTLATDTYSFRLNSLFDPDISAAGHQPYGFDQMATLYAHYRVFKCSWHIEFAPSSDRIHITVIPVNGSVVGTTVPAVGEQPLGVTKAMAFDGGNPCIFKGGVYLPRLAGATSTQYKTDDRYSASVSTNPTEVMQLYILVFNPTGVTIDTSMNITLMYWAEFYDPNTVAQS